MKGHSIALFLGIVAYASVQSSSMLDAKETVLYSFKGGADGAFPLASLINVNGTLYGTTGGGGGVGCGGDGCGTVFSINPNSGAEKVLYSFCSQNNCTDGANPIAGLIDVNGILYGTTFEGGVTNPVCATFGCGTVFSLYPNSGVEKVLYSFCQQTNCADGALPYYANVVDVKGELYGTTSAGGNYNDSITFGTAFSLDPKTGAETVVYAFCSQTGCTDGETPFASLIAVKGVLYGTTVVGGNGGSGTVFALNQHTGAETVLYSFGSQRNDGELPSAGLIDVSGALFGTTEAGGGMGCGGVGCGTVFSINPSTGDLKTLYSFLGGNDGAQPLSDLLDVKGTLYGTTYAGGAAACGSAGCGTVFAVDPITGAETVLHSFCTHKSCRDGAYPEAALIAADGKLYGTTRSGGSGCGGSGCGTVFMLKIR